jgi:hypothetical protein
VYFSEESLEIQERKISRNLPRPVVAFDPNDNKWWWCSLAGLELLIPFATSNLALPPERRPCYSEIGIGTTNFQGASTMEWVAPQHEEIDLNCEVSSYANAEL